MTRAASVACGMCKGSGRLVPTVTQCAACGLVRDMPGPLCWACGGIDGVMRRLDERIAEEAACGSSSSGSSSPSSSGSSDGHVAGPSSGEEGQHVRDKLLQVVAWKKVVEAAKNYFDSNDDGHRCGGKSGEWCDGCHLRGALEAAALIREEHYAQGSVEGCAGCGCLANGQRLCSTCAAPPLAKRQDRHVMANYDVTLSGDAAHVRHVMTLVAAGEIHLRSIGLDAQSESV